MNNNFKPKILILSLAYVPFVGGAEIAVKEITKRLSDDFEFDLICARMDRKLKKKEKIDNVNIYRLGFGLKNLDKYLFTFFGFFKAWKLYKKNNYQIIWPIMAAYASFVFLFKIFFPKVKILLTLQEGDPLEYIAGLKRFKFFKPFYKFYFKKVDQVQAISNFLADWAKVLGVKKEKIVIIPNGINLPSLTTQSKVKHNNQKIILTVSRLVEKNGLKDLIKSFHLLVTHYPLLTVKLIIVGDGPLRPNLEKLVNELNLIGRVEFVGGVLPENVAKYYAAADVFVRPSLSEGLGNSFLEAMANDVPVIATPVGGIPDFLKAGETGWFCQQKNPESIAEKIDYVLDEKKSVEVNQVIQNAKKMVLEKYTWEIVAEKMRNIFNKL